MSIVRRTAGHMGEPGTQITIVLPVERNLTVIKTALLLTIVWEDPTPDVPDGVGWNGS